MNDAIIAIGSNIEPKKNISQVEIILESQIVSKSPLLQTSPQGNTNQPDFLNGALRIKTTYNLHNMKAYLRGIEAALGRKRSADKNAPRTIDLDVVVFNGEIVNNDFYKYDFTRKSVEQLLSKTEIESLTDNFDNNKSNKTAFFAGIGRLGVDIAVSLLEDGWKIALSYRKAKTSEQVVNRLLKKFGSGKVFTFAACLEDFKQSSDFIAASINAFGKPDALINIASDYPKELSDWQRWKTQGEITGEDWQYYDSNFMVARNPIMALLESGKFDDLCIINFGDARSMLYNDTTPEDPYKKFGGILSFQTCDIKDVALNRLPSFTPNRHKNPYTLAKIDLIRLTETLALQCAPNIRINTIAPGAIIPPPDRDGLQAAIAVENTPLKKWGSAKPITQTVRFLIDNSFITGQTIKVDGGMELYLSQKERLLIDG